MGKFGAPSSFDEILACASATSVAKAPVRSAADADFHAVDDNMYLPRNATHARIDPKHGCRRISLVPATIAANVTVRSTSASSDPCRRMERVGGGSPLVSHAFLSRAARVGLRVERAGWTAALSHRVARRACSPARCRSTRRRTPTANTCSTGPGRMPIAVTAGATIRSSSRRFRSRRRRARGSRTDDSEVRAALAARTRCDGGAAARSAAIRRIRRCTSCFRPQARGARCAAAGMIVRHGVQFRWENSGLSRLRRLPRRVQPRQAQESEAGAAPGRGGRRRVHAQGRRRNHRRGLGIFLSLLRAHLSGASLDALPVPRVLRAHRRRRCRATCCSRSATAATTACARRSMSSMARTLWGRYWGTTERVSGPALRSLLLPGDRILHRARRSRASRAARRASTSSPAASCR